MGIPPDICVKYGKDFHPCKRGLFAGWHVFHGRNHTRTTTARLWWHDLIGDNFVRNDCWRWTAQERRRFPIASLNSSLFALLHGLTLWRTRLIAYLFNTLGALLSLRTFKAFWTFSSFALTFHRLAIVLAVLIVTIIATGPTRTEAVAAVSVVIVIVIVAELAIVVAVRLGLLLPIAITLRFLALSGNRIATFRLFSAFALLAFALSIIVRLIVFKLFLGNAARELEWLPNRLCGQPNTIVVIAKLVIAFRHHGITGTMRVAAKLHIFFSNRLRCAAQFDVWTIRVIDPIAARATTATAASTAIVTAIAITIAVLVVVIVVLSGSHGNPSSVATCIRKSALC
jgi:hypothetical protein